jgi:hypothetical protein
MDGPAWTRTRDLPIMSRRSQPDAWLYKADFPLSAKPWDRRWDRMPNDAKLFRTRTRLGRPLPLRPRSRQPKRPSRDWFRRALRSCRLSPRRRTGRRPSEALPFCSTAQLVSPSRQRPLRPTPKRRRIAAVAQAGSPPVQPLRRTPPPSLATPPMLAARSSAEHRAQRARRARHQETDQRSIVVERLTQHHDLPAARYRYSRVASPPTHAKPRWDREPPRSRSRALCGGLPRRHRGADRLSLARRPRAGRSASRGSPHARGCL